MKPTKARLKNLVDSTLLTVLSDDNKDKSAAINEVIESWWLGLDPDFAFLQDYYKKVIERNSAGNKVLEILNEQNIQIYTLRFNSTTTSFDEFREEFFRDLRRGDVPGVEKVVKQYRDAQDDAKETYGAIKANLDRLPVKQGLAYLEELGFDVTVFKEVEALPPMIVVEKKDIRFPKKAADAE